ncbi:MAG: PHP domain-containing protein [Candidatus Obscuribacterales bacterium]|jgi:DNA polymerase (family 10)|nr:PHP domain-containing protein [Candidatus Obscuribacterales bacterium]
MDKFDIANALREAGLMLTIAGDNPYKARAYLKGASSVESLGESIETIIKENRLTDIPGIGSSLAAQIEQLYKTGELPVLTKMREQLPPGVIELSQVPGMTLKRIELLSKELSITTVDELEDACMKHRVCKVKGFGEKSEQAILEGLRNQRSTSKKALLLHARPTAEQLVKYLRAALRSEQVEIVGTVRRWHEVVDEIKVVVATDDADHLWQAVENFPLVVELIEKSESVCRVKLVEGLIAEIVVVPNFHVALVEHTGTPYHFNLLRERAKDNGIELTAEGMFKKGRKLALKSESDVYLHLDLEPIPPELREGDDEIQQAESSFDDLIHIADIQGMTHCHTTYSDGSYSIEEMALGAQKMGMKYITITDHSPAASYAGGLTLDRLKQQWDEIDRVQERVDIKILRGTESDILADGRLDYPDHILEKFDIIIASVHNRFKLNHEQMTKRVLTCMKDPHFKVWGHPLGRLLLRREPIDCDVEKILDAVAESNAAVEINGDPHRMDFEPRWVKAARARGIKILISTDAHSLRDYRNLEFGVHLARRAGVRRAEVLNALDLEDFRAAVCP